MKKAYKRALLLLFPVLFIAIIFSYEQDKAYAVEKFITIGTGGVTGVYYPAGGAICRLVNRNRKDHHIRCTVESTGGSIYNLNALRNRELEIAVAQSDWQYNAFKGEGPFKEMGDFTKLRSLFSLHTEPFTVVARKDAGVKKLDDIVAKRVNIGNIGSGMRATMDVIMEHKGWTKKTFKQAAELKATEQAQALCDNKIDVMIYAAGHPNGAIQEVTTTCESVIIPIDGPDIDQLLKKYPYYSYTIIPGGMYAGNPNDVKTFGVKATFVTSADVSDEIIYEVVKSVFDNFDNFKTLHPVFATLDPVALVREGNTAPVHSGALKYYKEKKLISSDEIQAREKELKKLK